MNRDFVEMLSALSAEDAEFLLVGAHALSAHGVPRATGDLDIWVRPTEPNARRVFRALESFGAPLRDLTIDDLTKPDTVFQIGVPPNRIDLLTGLSGLNFESSWNRRIMTPLDQLSVPVLSRVDFVANKKAVGRPKDLSDLALLEELDSRKAN